jgi:hypothetical protein
MKTFDFVQLAISALGSEIQGKTNLQKRIFFLGELTGQLDELGYRPHFYGPYSDDVAAAVEDLKTVGFLDQNVQSSAGYDESGFERRRYDYQLTETGRSVANAKKARNAELWTQLGKAVDKLKSAGDLDYMRLSLAAKIYFLLGKQQGEATRDQLARLARQFGWRVTPKEITDAGTFLEQLGLVTIVTE